MVAVRGERMYTRDMTTTNTKVTPETLTRAQVVALQYLTEGEDDDTAEACGYWLWCCDNGAKSPPALEPYTQMICDALNADRMAWERRQNTRHGGEP